MITPRARLGAAAVFCAAALLSGCSTTDGTPIADPDELKATTSVTVEATSPTTTTTPPVAATTTPPTDVPAPANAQTMTCTEYLTLDDATQKSVVVANGVTKNPVLVATLVGILCQRNTDATVNTVVNSMRDDIIHN